MSDIDNENELHNLSDRFRPAPLTNENEIIRNRDWRLRGVSSSPMPTNPTSRAVTLVVEQGNQISFNGRLTSILQPSAVALHLSSAIRMRSSAIQLQQEIIRLQNERNQVHINSADLTSLFFDLLEDSMSCVISSFSSLEAYVNSMLPNDLNFRIEKNNGQCTEIYNRVQAERHLSTNIKISLILPEVTGISLNKSTSIWSNYRHIQKVRNSLVHMKQDEILASADDASEHGESLISLLLDPKSLEAPVHAMDIMKHFSGSNVPRWLTRASNSM